MAPKVQKRTMELQSETMSTEYSTRQARKQGGASSPANDGEPGSEAALGKSWRGRRLRLLGLSLDIDRARSAGRGLELGFLRVVHGRKLGGIAAKEGKSECSA